MGGNKCVLVLCFRCGAGPRPGRAGGDRGAPAEKADKPDADKIAKLVAQLGSDNFDEREKASADLEAAGDSAFDALHVALKSTDEEVRKRAEVLIGKIEKRRESADALKPKHVHLVCKDTPLTEAVEDLKKQTGYKIVLSDPENKLKDRKVTLDTGDMTFWQALDQFCDKAGLQETESASNGLAATRRGHPASARSSARGGFGISPAPGGAAAPAPPRRRRSRRPRRRRPPRLRRPRRRLASSSAGRPSRPASPRRRPPTASC